ncbi:MAG: DJ-1/PfpI family protein [Chitinophagaceae bacterium]|nr:DJ-1/PfpI family protein [Chitinophagaceae bacterium]MBP6590556.1 DJ-1/PfpI family protein [Chitinophagaceae bacterium]
MSIPVKFIFLIFPEVHLLDLAGPDQVISEAIDLGANFEIEYCGINPAIKTSAGLGISGLKHFSEVDFRAGDYIIVPGSRVKYILSDNFKRNRKVFEWLVKAHQQKVNLVSICVGVFVFAEAGILKGLPCTTHFQLTQQLRDRYPDILVEENTLFVSSDTIHTSAGIASGIDLMLYLLEQKTDSYFTHKVARELVVYNRRKGVSDQISPVFQYRNHIHAGIHRVQDYILENLSQKYHLDDLATIANMSERSFTRIFKKEIGITVNQYINTIRVERIKELLKNPELSKKQIANKVGLKSERQLERLLQ